MDRSSRLNEGRSAGHTDQEGRPCGPTVNWRYGDKLVHSGDADNPIRVMHKAPRIGDLSLTRARLTVIDAEAEPEGE
jgi:hypothetical protein